jgi:hypothetical protein
MLVTLLINSNRYKYLNADTVQLLFLFLIYSIAHHTMKEKEEILRALTQFSLGNHDSRVELNTKLSEEINEKLELMSREITRLYKENNRLRDDILNEYREAYVPYMRIH